MNNIRLRSRVDLMDFPEINQAVQAAEEELQDRGRVLLRTSGTEPLIRVMVEGEDEDEVDSIVQNLSARVEDILQQHI